MNIKSDIPQIYVLRQRVEQKAGFPLDTHGDFLTLSAKIEACLREHMSESTLERIWGYSTRRYDTVSSRSLNVLSRYIGFHSWEEFCSSLSSDNPESELFDGDSIDVAELKYGARIRVGWAPDRICIIRYLGDFRFIAEFTENSTMQPGDTFSCRHFQKNRAAHLDNFCKAGTEKRYTYIIGKNTGITTLEETD